MPPPTIETRRLLQLTPPPARADRSPSLPPPQQVRKLSVKRITSPITFDNMGHPVPDGLYDPAMGPTSGPAPCATCGLVAAACPGHFGHVELPVPVYNPLLFG